ncbi:MAG TPA: hypothetical protein VGM14_17995 [Streptosporangiaceae bacterium]
MRFSAALIIMTGAIVAPTAALARPTVPARLAAPAGPTRTFTSKAKEAHSQATSSTSTAAPSSGTLKPTTKTATMSTAKTTPKADAPWKFYDNAKILGPAQLAVAANGDLWLTLNSQIQRITPAGSITTYTGGGIITAQDPVAGPAGDIWFTDNGNIKSITAGGTVTTYDTSFPIPATSIVAGPGGDIWWTGDNEWLGKLAPGGSYTLYTDPVISNAGYLTVAGGDLWFTENDGVTPKIGRMTPGGQVTQFGDKVMTNITSVSTGPGGVAWFMNNDGVTGTLGSITSGGAVTSFTDKWLNPATVIATGADGAIWFNASWSGLLSLGRAAAKGDLTVYVNLGDNDTTTYLTADPAGGIWFSGGGPGQAGVFTKAEPSFAITSPPQGATIALSDPKYVTPQAGASGRAPDHRFLIVSGTAECAGPVQVNGVSAPVKSHAWTAQLPAGAGPLTITATASGCGQATEKVTLISLEIETPKENASVPITAAPAMPELAATVKVAGLTASTSSADFKWNLVVRGNTASRIKKGTAWHGYSVTAASGSTTGTSQAWKPHYAHVVGGIARLAVTASLPGVLDDPVTSDPRWFDIPGTNPAEATAEQFIQDRIDGQYYVTYHHIICQESTWRQFSGTAQGPAVTGVPKNWKPNPGRLRPLFGKPAGIGLGQVDPASLTSPDEYWDWQANLTGGLAKFHQFVNQASGWTGREQKRLAARIALIAKKAGIKNPPNAVDVPALTSAELLRQIIRYYNGGNEFHFGADYVLKDGKIERVGTDAWVESPAGVWPKHWTSLTERTPWDEVKGGDPNYVTHVQDCTK